MGWTLTDGRQIVLMAQVRLKRKQAAEDGLSRLAQTIVGQLPMVSKAAGCKCLSLGGRSGVGARGFDVSRCRRRKRREEWTKNAMQYGRDRERGLAGWRRGRSQDGSCGKVGTRSTEYQGEIDETSSQASEIQVTVLVLGGKERLAGAGDMDSRPAGVGVRCCRCCNVRNWEERREVLQPIWA